MQLLSITNLWPPFGSAGPPVAELSVHEQCLDAVQAKIQSLNLSGVDSDNIVLSKIPADRILKDVSSDDLTLPGVIVTPFGTQQMPSNLGTNRRDDVIYPVFVVVLDRGNQSLTAGMSRHLTWAQTIARAIRNQPLADVPGVYTCRIAGVGIYPLPGFNSNIDAFSIPIQCISREQRGS